MKYYSVMMGMYFIYVISVFNGVNHARLNMPVVMDILVILVSLAMICYIGVKRRKAEKDKAK